MHSWRSRYMNLTPPGRCCETRLWQDTLTRTVDTDMVVLAMTSAQRLNITELWIAFGARKNFRYLPAHEMANALSLDRCVTLPKFHAFTGCDTVSDFGSRGKRTVWDMWSAYDEVTPAFCALAATSETLDNWLCPLERLLVLLYDCTSSPECVNGVRKQFTQKVELLSSDTSSTFPAHKAGCSPSRSLLGTDDDRTRTRTRTHTHTHVLHAYWTVTST